MKQMQNSVVPAIERLATGAPPNKIRQSNSAQFVAGIPFLRRNRRRIRDLYANTRIDTRYMAIDLTADGAIPLRFERLPIQARMQMYRRHAVALAERVVRKALRREPLDGKDDDQLDQDLVDAIRQVVVVSSTGLLAPGLDAMLIERLGLRRDTTRTPVSFMGCAAAMGGLRIACDHVRACPEDKVLMVCVELSSVNATFADELNDIVTHSLFGDGCAVALVGACREDEAARLGRIAIEDHLSYFVEDTKDGIMLGILDKGIICKLSPQLPSYIENNLGKGIERFLEQQGLGKDDIDLWAVHPGGVRIIERVQRSLNLGDEQLADSWAVLRRYGNTLSPAVLFVIERMLRRIENENWAKTKRWAKQSLTGLAFSFAPGVSVEGILFRKFLPLETPSKQAFPKQWDTGKSDLQVLSIP